MGEHLRAENLPAYAIAIHGVKGSCYGVGALQAGRYAERLEQLAKDQEKETVLAENGAFITYMEKLLDSICEALELYGYERKKPLAAAPDQALLQELREACGAYDINRVDQAMLRLESFEYESGTELVNWLRRQVDDMNFDEIFNNTETSEEAV
jgi:chemotaxis protein histidine kinase CheA